MLKQHKKTPPQNGEAGRQSLGQVKGGLRQEDAWEGLSTGAGDPWELWAEVVVQPHSCHGSSQSPCSQHHLAQPSWDQFVPWRFRFGVRGGVAVMHTWGHTETFTQAHRDRQVCKYKHTGTPRTPHPATAQINPSIQTHTPIIPAPPQGVTTGTPQAQRHTHTHKGRCPRHGHSPSQALHTHNPTLKRCHTHAVSHTCKWHKYSVIRVHTAPHSVMQCHTPSVTVSHTPCHPHTAPISPVPAQVCRPSRLLLRAVTEPRRALPNRAMPSRNRAEPAVPSRTGPC